MSDEIENERLVKELLDSPHLFPEIDVDDYYDTVLALALHLELNISQLDEIEEECGNTFSYDGAEYFCADGDDTDKAFEGQVEGYIEECVMHEIPEHIHIFLDKEEMHEHYSQDGWAHSLGLYDGNGYEEEVCGDTYFICRVN